MSCGKSWRSKVVLFSVGDAVLTAEALPKYKFPYLPGTKICNYWLYVIYQYTDRVYQNMENLTVAPDTHVCKASHKLGLIDDEEFASGNVQQIVIDRWQELLQNTMLCPIDVHTPLWLWSRNGFPAL